MSDDRITLISADDAPEELNDIYATADSAMVDGNLPGPTLFGNQVRALAHNPALLKALIGVYEAFAETQTVDRKYMELGVLVTSRVNACEYCLQHHTPLGAESGLTHDQLDCIDSGTWNIQRELWSDEEWVVIEYAEQMTREPHKISEEMFQTLHRYFDDRQIVDMSMRFALCSAWNKFNDALGLNTESAFQHAYADLMGKAD